MRLSKVTLIISLIMFIIGCEKQAPLELTAEQGVYETLFVERVGGNTYSKYYLAGATENEWFINNPINNAQWDESLDELGNIPMELVEELYRVNRESHPLNWRPIVTNAEMLPPSFAVRAKPEKINERCLVEEGKGNTGLEASGKGKGEYRSYYSVSKVAFTKNGKMALVKFSYLCAPLSGAGEFFVAFELHENKWHPIGGRMLWIS